MSLKLYPFISFCNAPIFPSLSKLHHSICKYAKNLNISVEHLKVQIKYALMKVFHLPGRLFQQCVERS